MPGGFDFDYELSFVNNFDLDVIEYSIIPEKDNGEFISLIEDTIKNISLILSLQPGVNSMATFVNFENNRYKIIFNKIE